MDLYIENLTVQAQAVDKLREAIVTGYFAPGQRLAEADLGRMLGISRGSLREALRRLEGERLVVMTPNRGPSVPALASLEAAQICDLIALLMGEAAALAARQASADQLASLDSTANTPDIVVRADRRLRALPTTVRFFQILSVASANIVLLETSKGLLNCLQLTPRSPSKVRVASPTEKLRRISDAISSRDVAAARRLAKQYFRAGARVFREAP